MNAKVLKEVSFGEAMEMALFGAKYMHPRGLEPVIDTKIPIRIRNTFNVKHNGTIIAENPSKESQKIVKSVNVIRHTALIDVSGWAVWLAHQAWSQIFRHNPREEPHKHYDVYRRAPQNRAFQCL